jgi:uncharacterized membrane protein YhaH (DUF805 family)
MEKLESDYNMIDWWKKVVVNNYANFKGRARRAEYWYFSLANFLMIIPFYILAIVGVSSDSSTLMTLGVIVYVLIALATIVPGLAVVARRLHDINKSGWYYFIAFIPLIGGIILLVWLFTDGNRFENNYGADPKNINEPEFDFEQTQKVS